MSLIESLLNREIYKAARKFVVEFSAAWLLFIAFVITYNYYHSRALENEPVTEYFDVRQIGVPSFPVGANPPIIYDRTILRAFYGHYLVEVQEAGTLQALPECTGSADVAYEPGKKLPIDGPTLFWFLGHSCKIPQGAYRLEACWDVHRRSASTVHYCKNSAPFNVIDPENMGSLK